ncbi:hypothetical protein DMA15_35325 [Streptomyces sp. WAC 01529]|uniref:hypothetical protein n=1 Tax=Streptomyces sp. WAC 01529 TaxID=2203205 RepID=UPI000F6F5B19|nr:hypothetical protein [Streptomyces sp. WAC 01529]AZM57180.1 hypothetical protein DMA15_35325 [Streptomyces sp. WAC 01529]
MSSSYAPAPGGPLARFTLLFLLPLLTAVGGFLLPTGQAQAHAVPAVAHPTGIACTSNDPAVCMIREMTPEQREEARETRSRYHRLLDGMELVAERMRAAGSSDEEIARTLVAMRNEAKDITRAGMSPEAVEALEARNMKKYGNPLGPTADQQFAKYGSWAAVIEASTRSSAAVDQELGLEPRRR